MNRLARTAIAAAAAAGIAVGPARAVSAEEVLVGQHGTHSIIVDADMPSDTEDPNTFADIVPLDGMCGFAGTKLVLDDITETYFVQYNPQTGAYSGIGKILDETFELTQYDAEGNVVRIYSGTGDEYAQFLGTGTGEDRTLVSSNLRVILRGSSDDGTRLSFSLKLRLRFDRGTGELVRFEALVDSCHVH